MTKSEQVRQALAGKQDYVSPEVISSELNGDVTVPYAKWLLKQMVQDGTVVSRGKGKLEMFKWTGENQTSQPDKPIVKKVPFCTVAETFESIESLVTMVAKGSSPSMMVTGTAGIGKSYLVTETLGKCGVDFVSVKGHSSPLGLYTSLYEHNDQVIVFDDCDSIFQNPIAINILKAGLDSTGSRTISWNGRGINEDSSGIPNDFVFTGRIIFISNLDQSKIDDAVKSRTLCINLALSRQDIIERMRELLKYIEADADIATKTDVLNFIEERMDEFENFNIRTLIKGVKVAKHDKVNWKRIIMLLS